MKNLSRQSGGPAALVDETRADREGFDRRFGRNTKGHKRAFGCFWGFFLCSMTRLHSINT